MNVKDALKSVRISYAQMAKRTGLAKSTLCRAIIHGEYPARADPEELKRRVEQELSLEGLTTDTLSWPDNGRRPHYEVPHTKKPDPTEELDLMQLDRNVLAHFGLRSNPFLNDVEAEEDVFVTKGYSQVVASIKDAIEQRGFVAVVAESGCGKTTIWDGIESEYAGRDDVIICKPLLKTRENITPEHLCRALIYGLMGDDTRIPNDGEDRGRMLSAALRAVRTGTVDRKAVLYIDDAHFCNASVLRQLKTFFEEKVGRYRLLAIVLVGLPQLKTKLALFAEVGNRIRLLEVPPVPVKEYLEFKLRRVGSSVDKLFDAGGIAAFLERFKQGRQHPLGEPLIINASCIRAMCKLYDTGGEPGEKIGSKTIDALPGATTARRVA